MLRFTATFIPATFSAYLALNTTPGGWFSAVLCAVICGFGTACIWWAVGDLLRLIHRNAYDTSLMQGGYCPECKKPMTMEVTSQQSNVTFVECNDCGEHFTVTASERGPLVRRHGKGYRP